MSTCRSTFEPVPVEERDGTHTCDRPVPHYGPHRCPTCGVHWLKPPGKGDGYLVDAKGVRLPVTPPAQERP